MHKRTDLDGLDSYIARGYAASKLAELFDFDEKYILARKAHQLGSLFNVKIAPGQHVRVKPIYQKVFPGIIVSGIVKEDLGGMLRVQWSGNSRPSTISAQYVERVA